MNIFRNIDFTAPDITPQLNNMTAAKEEYMKKHIRQQRLIRVGGIAFQVALMAVTIAVVNKLDGTVE